MADDPTIEEVAAAKARLERNAALIADGVCYAATADLRTLLASHASLEERVKEAKRLMGPAIEAGRSFEPVGGFGERALEGWAAALAAFVNEKET